LPTKSKAKPVNVWDDPDNVNLCLWNKVAEVPSDKKYPVRIGGLEFTAIVAQWQLKQATALWGGMGCGWGMRNFVWTRFEATAIDRSDRSNPVTHWELQLMLEATLYYPPPGLADDEPPWCEITQAADMPFVPNGDTVKKLITRVRSKALSCLGFGADVYMGFDDQGYTGQKKAPEGVEAAKSNYLKRIAAVTSLAQIMDMQIQIDRSIESGLCPEEAGQDLTDALERRREQLRDQ